MKVEFIKLKEWITSPQRGHDTDSGIDFYNPKELTIYPWENIKINLWIKVNLPEWYDLTFINKSWIASKTWLITGGCLIDNWYTGELVVNLINTSKFEVLLLKGQKIIQGVIRAVEYPKFIEVKDFSEWEAQTRGEDWFWSTWLFNNLKDNE